MTRVEMRPGHVSRILWSIASSSTNNNNAAGQSSEQLADVVLVNAIRSTVRNKEYTASDAAAVLWCVATLKTMGAAHGGGGGGGGGGNWGDLEEEKNKWIRNAASAFYERDAELTLDEREATRWALTQMTVGSKKRGSFVESNTEALDDLSSPNEAKFMIDTHGRLARIARK